MISRSRQTALERLTLRERAEAYFEADFSQVSARIDQRARSLGALAVTSGEDILLAPEATALSPGDFAQLMGHELAHVVQQRQGLATAQRYLAGTPLDDRPELEAEADLAGWCFANRPDIRPARLVGQSGQHRNRAPVVQRSLVVGGVSIRSITMLSPAAQSILSLITHGRAWLDWAITAPTKNYDFASEARLLVNIQAGLHSSPLCSLSGIGLQVSPFKLMTLAPQELARIHHQE